MRFFAKDYVRVFDSAHGASMTNYINGHVSKSIISFVARELALADAKLTPVEKTTRAVFHLTNENFQPTRKCAKTGKPQTRISSLRSYLLLFASN